MYQLTSKGAIQLTNPSVENYEDPVASPTPSVPKPVLNSSSELENARRRMEAQNIACANCKKAECDCNKSRRWLWIFSLIILVLVGIVLWLLYEDGSLGSLMSSMSSKSSKSGKSSRSPSKSR